MNLPEIHDFLGCRTPDAWVAAALADQQTLLIDHKNNEFKAASTAMALMAKYATHLDLINFMSRLAREELVHHEQVLRIMKRRKIDLRPVSASRYASGLRKLVRSHEPQKLVDTLVVGAFIEARLQRWTPADCARTFPDEWDGQVYQVSRSWVIYHVMEHDLHHGGEVSLILGMNGLRSLDL